jgi:hypothetical protein
MAPDNLFAHSTILPAATALLQLAATFRYLRAVARGAILTLIAWRSLPGAPGTPANAGQYPIPWGPWDVFSVAGKLSLQTPVDIQLRGGRGIAGENRAAGSNFGGGGSDEITMGDAWLGKTPKSPRQTGTGAII